jgi:hypothetical protein
MERQDITTPKFASEAEEAQWWFEHQDSLLEKFKSAEVDGTLGRGRALQRALAADVILLDEEDAVRALAAAQRRGMQYQAYVKKLVHEALEKESAA